MSRFSRLVGVFVGICVIIAALIGAFAAIDYGVNRLQALHAERRVRPVTGIVRVEQNIWEDVETGCQYLSSSGFRPRMEGTGAEYRHRGCR